MYQTGLVLEGGGMKGVYTGGVLDFFQDKGLEFSSVYGVSAGACQMSSYLAKQRGRGKDVMVDYLTNKHYMGAYSLITTGDVFGADMNYDLVPNFLNPFDFDTYAKYQGKAYAVVTNIETGNAEYIRIRDMHEGLKYIRASSSLPLVSRNVRIDGKLYLDGGIADAIPIQRSKLDGNLKNVVVMTKEAGFRRAPDANLNLIRIRYLRYPKVYELMKRRHIMYNQTLDYIAREKEAGNLFLIQPEHSAEIDRLEKNPQKLEALYEEGYRDAQNCYESLISFLENNSTSC